MTVGGTVGARQAESEICQKGAALRKYSQRSHHEGRLIMPDNTDPPTNTPATHQPQVFAVQRDLSGGWKFTRRGFVTAAGIAAAGAALAGCGSDLKSGPTAVPPTSTPDFATSRTHISSDIVAHPSLNFLLLSSDQTRLISGGTGIYKLWTFPSGQLLKEMTGATPGIFHYDATITQDSSLMIVTMPSNQIGLYALPDDKLIKALQTNDAVDKLIATPDNHLLISATYKLGSLKLWSLPDGNSIENFGNVSEGGYPTAVSPDGTLLAAAYNDNNVALWSLRDGELVKILAKDALLPTLDVQFSPDGKYLAEHYPQENQDCRLRLWSIPEGEPLWEIPVSGIAQLQFAFSPDSKVFAAQDPSFGLKLWDTASGDVLGAFDQVSGPLNFSPDGSLVATAHEKTVVLRSASTGEVIWTLPHDAVDHAVALLFTADSSELLVGRYGGAIHRWSVSSREFIAALVDPEEVPQAVQFQTVQLESGDLVPIECGSGLPDGAVCTCNCVTGSGCACVGDVAADSGGSSGGGHYWYPN